jgi:small-conductance mechanosensitive channel
MTQLNRGVHKMQDTLQELIRKLDKLPQKTPELADRLSEWGMTHGIRILLILFGMWLLVKIAGVIGKRIIKIAEDDDPTTENDRERRAKTLAQIFKIMVKTLVIAFGSISIIKELGFDIGPVLAGAGILGLAIGFGSQSLVKDIVSGFFLIMENQIRVGDVVRIGEISGTVEKITLRIVVLRDIEAIVHVIPNGEIKTLSNLTYGWSRAVINIGVSYKENVDNVMAVLKDIGVKLALEEKYKSLILEEPTILGVDSLGENAVNIKVLFKTVPLMQWDVGREFRRRVKNEFDRLGIEIPYQQRTVYIRDTRVGQDSTES